ncbi:CCT domain [Plasmopara halstedii]|uniref:CCT domain n=1 Tax=Plasmopara halstedii TaxID=4781 RepID=A0A0P1AHB4_PLAHL|nr:CCT domain [Plasmopara halstedii]CEG40288.1 CCT domain [Plasmopara halstedii]|eukprot:XP_024576657.1 CCT domain [Plasmopara halstedii]
MEGFSSPSEESKSTICLSPQEKLVSAAGQRTKRSHSGSVLATTEVKVARLDDMQKSESEPCLDGWISDDYLRTMDFDDRLSQDIDWVAHDEMDLALSMDTLPPEHVTTDDVNDFSFGPSFLRGSLTLEDPAEMSSIFDPVYIFSEPISTKDAETLLMSFDTMNFKIPSPTSTTSKKRTSIFSNKHLEPEQTVSSKTTESANTSSGPESSATEELRMEQTHVNAANNSVTSLLSVLDIRTHTTLSNPTEKKIGSYSPKARKLRLQKFHEKRKNRTWKKSIKYDCRKKLADDRPRIKGRFVRVHENASAETNVASCSATPLDSMAGYASPKSPTNSILSPAMVPAAKVQVPRVATPLLTPQTPAASVPKPTSSSATSLSFARIIASV